MNYTDDRTLTAIKLILDTEHLTEESKKEIILELCKDKNTYSYPLYYPNTYPAQDMDPTWGMIALCDY